MKSIPLQKPDRRIGAPPKWNHEADGICHTLDVWDLDGFLISAWEPSETERRRIAEGAPIYLHIGGRVHPVVRMAVGEPTDIGRPDMPP